MMRSMRSAGVARMSQNENIPALLITTSTPIPSAAMRSYSSCAAPDPRQIYRNHPHVGRHGFHFPAAVSLSAADALFRTAGCARPVPVRPGPGFPRSLGNPCRRFAPRRPRFRLRMP